MVPSVVNGVNEVNADISNNPTKLSQPVHHDTPPATPPNYESTYQNRHAASDVEGTKHIWIITGPAGCGKTTVAKAVSEKLNMHYLEGDDFHSKANVDKMANGIPLTDEDRWDWLLTLRQASINTLSKSSPESHQNALRGVVVTCSALKKSYRDVLRGHAAPLSPNYRPDTVSYGLDEKLDGHWNDDVAASERSHHIKTHFLYLSAPEEVLIKRVGGREGHYMGANMVKSQLQTLQVPEEDELDCLKLDVSPQAEVVKERAVRIIGKRMEDVERS